MATFNKIQIGKNTYDISLSPNGKLDQGLTKFRSGDTTTNPTSYTSVTPISIHDTNADIFVKLTTMVKNIRFIYYKIGTVVLPFVASIRGCVQQLYDIINNKALSEHTHTIENLPTTNELLDDSTLVPTAGLLYYLNNTLNTRLNSINNNAKISSFTTNINCAGIPRGTYIDNENFEDIFRMLLVNTNS